jgi:sugar phosphate isomerase/epimerase
MVQFIDTLGIQSYCFRGFKDNAKVAELLKQTGLSRIEVCAAHIDFSDESLHEPTIAAYEDAGCKVVSIGVENIDIDSADLRKRFEFCKKAGAKMMSVNFNPATSWEKISEAQKLAEQYDIRMGIHNHGGYHWLGNKQMLDHIFAEADQRGCDRLGLCLDTAWAIDAKQNPVDLAQRYATRLFGVHIKDFIYTRERQSQDVIVGTGILDLPKLLEVMDDAGFDGACVLEYEADVNDPVPALTKCVEEVRKAQVNPK